MEQSIEFDRLGRMRYHPEYHHNHGKPWTSEDKQYLIEYYEKVGPEEVSLSLGRTIKTVMEHACRLRKTGDMPIPKRITHHPRMMRPSNVELSGVEPEAKRTGGTSTQTTC